MQQKMQQPLVSGRCDWVYLFVNLALKYDKNHDYYRIALLGGQEHKIGLGDVLKEILDQCREDWPRLHKKWDSVVTLLPAALNLGLPEDQLAQTARAISHEPEGHLANAISNRDAQAMEDILEGRVERIAESVDMDI